MPTADSPLISVADLFGLIASSSAAASSAAGPSSAPAPVLLDVRWSLGGPPGIEEFCEGHLPGAVFTDLDRDLAEPPGKGGRHPLPSAADFQESMRRLGVSDGRPVVVYDAADSTAAARAWWLLRYFGHPDVRVLDGGYRAWEKAGLPEVVSPPQAAERAADVPGDFTARPGHLPLLDADAAAALAETGLLLDARAEERYRGETEPADPVAGHIPGAISAPTAGNVTPDGTFLSRRKLTSRFASLGIKPTTTRVAAPAPEGAAPGGAGSGGAGSGGAAPEGAAPGGAGPDSAGSGGAGSGGAHAPSVGAYCGSGVTAAHEVLALALAGIPAALYAGSWSDWITDPSRPVATGPV